MAVHDPSGVTGGNVTQYSREIAGATYQRMVALPRFDDEGRPLNSLILRKYQRVTASTLSQSATGLSLTQSTIVGTPVTLTPAGNYIEIAQTANYKAQMDINITEDSKSEVNQAMAEASDTLVLAAVSSFTQTMSQASIDGPAWRQACARVAQNTNGVAIQGGGKRLFAIFSVTQLPNFGNIPEYNQADMRGDSQNPYVSGVIMKGNGYELDFTTVVAQDANGWHNFIGIPEAIAVAWNVHTELQNQQIELQYRLIAFNNFATGVFHDLRGLDFRTTASGL